MKDLEKVQFEEEEYSDLQSPFLFIYPQYDRLEYGQESDSVLGNVYWLKGYIGTDVFIITEGRGVLPTLYDSNRNIVVPELAEEPEPVITPDEVEFVRGLIDGMGVQGMSKMREIGHEIGKALSEEVLESAEISRQKA